MGFSHVRIWCMWMSGGSAASPSCYRKRLRIIMSVSLFSFNVPEFIRTPVLISKERLVRPREKKRSRPLNDIEASNFSLLCAEGIYKSRTFALKSKRCEKFI